MAQQPSLAEQMTALQRKVDRAAEWRQKKREGSNRDDTYSDAPPRPKRRADNATGGLPLGGAAAAAAAAVAAAGQLAGPALHRCQLCDATFGSEREMAVHVEGAAHRKALERQAAEAERRQRLGVYADVAASALAAGGWQGGGRQQPVAPVPRPSAASASGGNAASLGGRGGGGRGQPSGGGRSGGPGGRQQGRGQPQQGRGGRGRGPWVAGPPAPHPRELTSHGEMLRQARGAGAGPLDIDGWVPPSVPALAQQQEQQQRQQQAGEEHGGREAVLGALVSDSEDAAASSGSGSSSQEGGAPPVAAGGAAPPAGAALAGGPGGSADSDGSDGSDSESGGAEPVASFFTFT